MDYTATVVSGLPLRTIGPAFMGGRIADIAIHPTLPSTWYLAVGSGGVWKTTNSGTTWTPIFDEQGSYSIATVVIAPSSPEVIWVGTGENVSGRHVGWGDGVYRSIDGGDSWDHRGLEQSEHIGAILVDPRHHDTVYVAAEGPLWSSGGQRGVFKTTDGGDHWDQVLCLDDDTGVTSLVFAPDDPETIYAAAYQRRRRVWSFAAGGPGSGIYKSTDAGHTWRQVTRGLPEGDMGKIGLAVTPTDPALIYATIEADEKNRGFYRSVNRGESWEKRNKYISGGTGPHYYQRIFACPHDPERVYQMDVFIQVSTNGGEDFQILESGKNKHSDNHVLWIDPGDARHLLAGCDAGLYESFDQGHTWRHFANLPISQFYRIAVDNSLPFFNVLAGAQDLGTLFGPSRTSHLDGVRNQDWSVALGADGYHAAFDPEDPDISYIEWQNGNVMRHNRRTMELCDIQPQPGPSEPPERWNWDTPILVSPHQNSRIYVGSQRIWRSDDRGDSWTAMSPDLTTNQNRYELPVGERVLSTDSLYDHAAMSHYSTITHITESPVAEDLIYVGTDDGLIHVSPDAGVTCQRATNLPGLPEGGYINDIEASQHDRDTVFAAADAHKNGDYHPYIFASRDRGNQWESIAGDLPYGALVWAVEQDHINPDLLFLATEKGLFVTVDAGTTYHRLSKDVPTIGFRDLKLQRRDDDLVGASFGRGIYVLDDYSPLRQLRSVDLAKPVTLFPVRDAWWYVPYQPMQAKGQPTLGSTAYRAPNPPFGATFTYLVQDEITSAAQDRRKREEQQDSTNQDVEFPGWDTLWSEHVELVPQMMLVVRDESGQAIRWLAADNEHGLHRTTWDLRLDHPEPVGGATPDFEPPWASQPRGPLAPPGAYSVQLVRVGGTGQHEPVVALTDPQTFSIIPVPSLDGDLTTQQTAEFQQRVASQARRAIGLRHDLDRARSLVRSLGQTLARTPQHRPQHRSTLSELNHKVESLWRQLVGDQVAERLSEPPAASPLARITRIADHHWQTTTPPTMTQRNSLDHAVQELDSLAAQSAATIRALGALADDLIAAGGPWTVR